MARTRKAAKPIVERAELTTGSMEETQAVGAQIGRWLCAGDVVALRGELGAGKTTLVQGMARGQGRESGVVKSPTFVLVREYPGDVTLVHIDGYRLSGAPAAAWLDLELLIGPRKITVIEWAERFEGLLPERHVVIDLSHVSTNRRKLSVTLAGDWPADRIASLKDALQNAQPQATDIRNEKADDGNSGD
jgi:tRNA threonylcarbamoyladenosine biosynthesis protein TsaE